MLHFPLELTFLFLLPSKCGSYSSSEGNQGHEKEPHHTIANYQVNRSLHADLFYTSSMAQTEVKQSGQLLSLPPLFPTLLRQHLEGVSQPGFNQAHLHFSLFPLHICGGMTLLHFLSLLFQPGCVTGAVTWV